MIEKGLYRGAISAAEDARKLGYVVSAKETAGKELDLLLRPTFDERALQELINDPQQLATLATLSRIFVDASKSLANQSPTPSKALLYLQEGLEVITVIEQHPHFASMIVPVTKDPFGNTHHFAAEIERDKVKTLFAAAPLFPGGTGIQLRRYGEYLLQKTYNDLPNTHPTRPLIGIELALSYSSHGEDIDVQELHTHFTQLVTQDGLGNPDRVATVAGQVYVWAKNHQEEELMYHAKTELQTVGKDDDEIQNIVSREQNKLTKQFLRLLLFTGLVPVMTTQSARDSLHSNLMRIK